MNCKILLCKKAGKITAQTSSKLLQLGAIFRAYSHVRTYSKYVDTYCIRLSNYITLNKDNRSALSLEKNGRISSSKRTKHIKAKYFLIKDYYDAGEVDLRYCPTGRMWADVLTKPLQGQMFRDMRAFLQNCSRGYDDDLKLQQDEQAHQSTKEQVATVPSSRECVGTKQLRWADGVKLPKRDVSPTCVSQSSPYEVH